MGGKEPYLPSEVFGAIPQGTENEPRALISPHRYIQGQNIINNLGMYISLLRSRHPAVLISAGGMKRFGGRIKERLESSGSAPVFAQFGGECSESEVKRIVDFLGKEDNRIDSLIAVGGGKCLDAGKCVADRMDIPVVICPTIASTDAPCSAVSVMYSDDGVQAGPRFFKQSPALVVVDTQIIIDAPIRQLVAGMGDALATKYETRTCFNNQAAKSMIGARPTITARAIAELCGDTILRKGSEAVEDAKAKKVSEAFEQVVEANTLLSGIGFESGGLSTAHALAGGLTVIPSLHENYLHGELVGLGIVAQLLMEGEKQEAEHISRFLAATGLPATVEQFCLDIEKDAEDLKKAAAEAIESTLTGSEPFKVTTEALFEALREAHLLGLKSVESVGGAAYRYLHG
ncbi:MAG: glycerol dehydrogenase [Desulfobacteraceae bacterium]|nr:glycerol dehydrogenase [Desulfobacteraceae bacterium]